MPLSKPVKRRLEHQRHVTCHGYRRDDGLWDIEAHMTDMKTATHDNPERGGYVASGEFYHDMWMRFTLDKTMLIHRVEVCMDATPFALCPGIAVAYKQLEGTRIASGWSAKVKQLTAKTNGCTHLNELIKPIMTTAFQTLWPEQEEEMVRMGAKGLLNTCHTWSERSEVVKKYLPELYNSGAKT